MATVSASTSYAPTASRALSYLTERAEDAQAALKGILGGAGPGAAGPSGADRYLGGVDLGGGEAGVRLTRTKLESSLESDRLDGLRTVVAMISKSLPASNHLFPSVLKLTSAQSLQVKTLVYLVTLRLAPSQPDIALLSINSFQRDLSDSSPLIRGMSLRVLSGLGVKMAAPLMEMAIAKGVRDPSFYVRRIAADALGKCFELASSTLPSLLPHLSSLLGDRHPSVLGSALLAFNCTVPDRYDLLHQHFRRICHGLVDIDEWNQTVTLRVLAGYARTYLRQPSAEETRTVLEAKAEKVVAGRSKWGTGLDKDLELLLSKAEPLLLSRNSAVVLSTAHLYLTLLPIDSPRQQDLVQPLLRLLRGHPSQAHVVLLLIRRFLSLRPELFNSHSLSFLPLTSISDEPCYITEQKLSILVDLAIANPSKSSIKFTKVELDNAALYRSEASIVICAVRGLGRLLSSIPPPALSSASPQLVEDCTETLLTVLKERSGNKTGDSVVSAAMDVLRLLIKARAKQPQANDASGSHVMDSAATAHILYRLSALLFKANDKLEMLPSDGGSMSIPSLVGRTSIADGSGRASIYWLLGHFCRQELKVRRETSLSGAEQLKTLAEVVLPDILRKGCLNFGKESSQAKLALLTLSAKLHVFLPTTDAPPSVVASVAQLHSYLLQLGRFDLTYDVRDRARYYKNLTAGVNASIGQANGAHEATEAAETNAEDTQGVSSAGGVRLRREQVLLVLFGDRALLPKDSETSIASVSRSSNSRSLDPARYLDPLELFSSAAGHGVDTYGEEYEGSLPAWAADQAQLPPASVREPTTSPSNANTATSLSNSSAGFGFGAGPASAVRSISSSDSAALPAITSVTRGPSSARVVLTPTNLASDRSNASSPALGGSTAAAAGALGAAKQGKGKYKDLDDFLNEATESESEESSSEEEEDDDVESVEEENQESSEEEEEEEGAASAGAALSSSSSEDEDDSSDDDEPARQRGARPLLPEQNEWAM